jgi:predicted ATPase
MANLKKKKPFGYIYRATNQLNGKIYIGQSVTSRWKEDQNPIEERWKEEVNEAYRRHRRGENLRYIEYSIIKNGPENFKIVEQDTAQNREELNEKENKWMREYNTLDSTKGYNVMEVGRGGRLTEIVKEKMSKTHEAKWLSDLEYIDKQISERKERAKDPDWIAKMVETNQEIS